MDAIDRLIVNVLQDDFPICDCPFERLAEVLHLTEDELIARTGRLIDEGVISRLGPLFNVERMGGAFTLAAMAVPTDDFERVCAIMKALPEVAHNYQREHALNMWFVLATEHAEDIAPALARVERAAGYAVVEMPKVREYFVGLKLECIRNEA